jgi:hypothetical protein
VKHFDPLGFHAQLAQGLAHGHNPPGRPLAAQQVVAFTLRATDDADAIGPVFKGLEDGADLQLAGADQAIDGGVGRKTVGRQTAPALGNGLLRGVMATEDLDIWGKTHRIHQLITRPAGGYQSFVFGLVQTNGPGRTFGRANPAAPALPGVNRRHSLPVDLGNPPRTNPNAGEAGDAEIALHPGRLALVQQILLGDHSLIQSHLPDGTHDIGKAHILGADKNTAPAFGTKPDQLGSEQLVLQSHPDHVDDLPGIEIRNGLTDRTGPAAGPAGKAAVEMLAARQGGNLGAETGINLLVGYCHKKPLVIY